MDEDAGAVAEVEDCCGGECEEGEGCAEEEEDGCGEGYELWDGV